MDVNKKDCGLKNTNILILKSSVSIKDVKFLLELLKLISFADQMSLLEAKDKITES